MNINTSGSSPNPLWSGEFRKRLLTASVLLPVSLAAVILGGSAFALFLILAGIFMADEFTTIVTGKRHLPTLAVMALGTATGVGYAYFGNLLMLVASIFVTALIAFALAPAGKRNWILFGVFYCLFPVVALFMLRADALFGLTAVLFVMTTVWLSDTAAYVFGRLYGRAKLAPGISPGKTWMGFWAAGLSGLVTGAITGVYVAETSSFVLALVGVLIAIVAQAGDLLESYIKRFFKIKDSGRLLPGHGGILDRTDGLISATVFAFLVGALKSDPLSAARGILLW